MKKLIAILLSLLFVLSLTACGGSTDTSSPVDTGSEDTSSEDLADGYPVEYTSVAKGYIDHVSIWGSNIVNFNGFECMNEEYLYLPAGTTIMCNEKFGVYCYEVKEEYLVLNETLTTEFGQQLTPELTIKMEKGSYVLPKDAIVRLVVKGTLSDIKLYVPLELESKVKLGKVEDFTTK